MRVFVSGDVHGTHDYKKIKNFRKMLKDDLTLDDYLIICGDFGLFWLNEKENQYMLNKVYKDFPCTILWVDGNHENFDKLYSYPTEEWNSGKVHRISDRILHLQRGEVFNLNGTKIFAFGGAKSTDRGYEFGDSIGWWKEELPNDEEYKNASLNLKNNNDKVDYIFTHDCDVVTLQELYKGFGEIRESDERFRRFLNFIYDNVEYKHWYFGHHHTDITINKSTCLYDTIREINL